MLTDTRRRTDSVILLGMEVKLKYHSPKCHSPPLLNGDNFAATHNKHKH
jgi:hypothetical protein